MKKQGENRTRKTKLRLLLYTSRFKIEPYFSATCFGGVGSSFIFCVFLYVCELIFMVDKGYIAESKWK